jgi:dTDP-glucose 4,6-dehydratase
VSKNILVTGGNGLVATQFIVQVLRETDWNVYTTVRSNMRRLLDATEEFSDEINQRVIIKGNYSDGPQYDIIVHLAAATDVGESITDPMKYVEQNIVETAKLLEFARTLPNLEKFIFISSNEVFGPAMYDVNYSELDRLNPYSPYSGTKAAAEQLCASYFNTYKMPISIVRTMNVFGERQTARRFFPVVVRKILDGEEINIFDNFRTYIHAEDVADAIMFIIKGAYKYPKYEHEGCHRYHVVGNEEVSNLRVVKAIGEILGIKPKYKISFDGRAGYEERYSMSGAKMTGFGWMPKATLMQRIEQMALWSKDNRGWIDG